MSLTPLGKTRRSVFAFTLILIIFLVVADGLIIFQQNKILRTEVAANTQHELDLFGKLVVGSLTKGDYVAVEEAILQWGKAQHNIVELRITAANNFIIANYKRETDSIKNEKFQRKIEFGFNNKATIALVKDMSAVGIAVQELAYQLILFSLLFVGFLGYLLQRVALRPLQQEISEHEQTENKLRMQAVELQESNKELESYSYSIAHDLRGPLRSIISFSQILDEEAGHKFSSEEKEYFGRIIVASKRMVELIDDILELGRITRSEIQNVEVDLTALAKSALERFCIEGGDRKVEWQVQEDLVVLGDKSLIALALDNLLENACKYSSVKNDVRIQFGVTSVSKGGNTIKAYFVRDNGVGFDMRYADKLFQPFHRLHDDALFEGTGIGLATAERVIHRHGGEIWAESEPNDGACFYFTLGKNGRNAK